MDAALRLGYVPSPHAVGLASGGQTRTVAIVVLFVTRWFFATVVHGAEQVLRERGYDVLLYNIGGDPDARRRVLLTQLVTKRADALIVVGLGPTPEEVLWLSRHGMPVVTLGSRVPEWPSARARLEGYRATLREAGVEPDPSLELEGRFTLEGGHDAGEELMRRTDRPTAVFCASDEMAFGVLYAAREAGVRVPEDLSVVGVDDHEMAHYVGLTTVRQPVLQQGRVAARQILQRLQGDDREYGHVNEHVELPTELVLRSSTAPPS